MEYSGNVDVDFLYHKILHPDFLKISGEPLEDKTYYYQNYAMQRNAWINDGTGWFFISEEGQPLKRMV